MTSEGAEVLKLIAWFGEVNKDDVGLVGGKGANLGELTRAGIPVPSGFVVTSDVYFQFLDECGLRGPISAALANIDVNQGSELQRVSNEIKELILRAQMPADRRWRLLVPTAR
jgi:pyruvate,water dikinase